MSNSITLVHFVDYNLQLDRKISVISDFIWLNTAEKK